MSEVGYDFFLMFTKYLIIIIKFVVKKKKNETQIGCVLVINSLFLQKVNLV